MNDSSPAVQPESLSTTSDEDLARRVQEGCRRSFTELAHRLQPRLLFVLRRRLGHEADAEDVTQKTLLRAFEKIEQYDANQKFSPWLFTIAIRLATDHHRKKQLPTTAGEPILGVRDPEPGPAQRLIAQEKADDIWTLAERILKPDQWTALWLLYGEGQSVRDIACTLKRTTVSVRVLLHRARKTLTPHLEKFAAAESAATADTNSSDFSPSPTLHVARVES